MSVRAEGLSSSILYLYRLWCWWLKPCSDHRQCAGHGLSIYDFKHLKWSTVCDHCLRYLCKLCLTTVFFCLTYTPTNTLGHDSTNTLAHSIASHTWKYRVGLYCGCNRRVTYLNQFRLFTIEKFNSWQLPTAFRYYQVRYDHRITNQTSWNRLPLFSVRVQTSVDKMASLDLGYWRIGPTSTAIRDTWHAGLRTLGLPLCSMLPRGTGRRYELLYLR